MKGRDAEARQNYEAAFDDYRQACDLRPKDTRYRAAFEHVRFLAGAALVHRGQLLREAGKLEEALAEFQKAAQIDPSSFIVQQEIRQTQRLIEAAKSPAPRAENRTPSSLQRRIEEAQGPVDLAPIANSPINLKITEDTKVIYDTVGKLAGINVLFDPDYTSRRINVELNNVTLDDALEIIAMESKTFWRAVTPNTIFVAQDSPGKRKEVEQNVIKTFYLQNLSQPTELQDISNTLRQIIELQRVQVLASEGAIVARGTPDQIALWTSPSRKSLWMWLSCKWRATRCVTWASARRPAPPWRCRIISTPTQPVRPRRTRPPTAPGRPTKSISTGWAT
jgi:general secretion pathway protein D